MDYWKECIDEALNEAEVSASPEQIHFIAKFVEGAHDNIGQAFYTPPSDGGKCEIAELKKRLAEEEDKVGCNSCKGYGYHNVSVGTSHYSTEDCSKCRGKGKISRGDR